MNALLNLFRRRRAARDSTLGPKAERCLACGANLAGSRTYERFRVCHACGRHYQLTAWERIATLLDPGTFRELDRGVSSIDPISFEGPRSYRSKVIAAQRRTGLSEAALTGRGTIRGHEVVIAVIDFGFLGGSIGIVAGERIARAIERATDRNIPFVSVCATSGTRVQEGLLALMQIPRIASAAQRHRQKRIPHVAVAADPTTGSGYAGFLNQADIIIGEPGAVIGYAPLRDLERDAGAELPDTAHRTEGHLERGLIDAVVSRDQLRDTLGALVATLHSDYRSSAKSDRLGTPRNERTAAWSQVQLSRHEDRPTARDLIARISPSFFEIRGDRVSGDGPAIVAGLGSVLGEAVVIIGQQRRRPGTHEELLIGPEGLRKARRAMRIAERAGLPLVTLIDTAGVHPGLRAEDAGVGAAIARCMSVMLDLDVPTVAVITGEAVSDAASALALADQVLMLNHATYEVIRPEDAARIIFQRSDRAEELAERLKLTSNDCQSIGVVDEILEEPGSGAHTDHDGTARIIAARTSAALARLRKQSPKRRIRDRYARYRAMGATRTWMLGTAERRLAHLADRATGLWNRLRRRSPIRRWADAIDEFDIPV